MLLHGPKNAIVPCQGAKLLLIKHGHVMSVCQFNKGMNEVQVLAKEAFRDKLWNPDFEILMPVHSKLLMPTLAPGQNGIDGVILH